MSKLHSIITTANGGGNGKCIKFGIIISKEKGPSTFKELAVKYYLSHQVVIISICGKELEELFDNKGNLLDLIERKASEIMMDATSMKNLAPIVSKIPNFKYIWFLTQQSI